MEAGDLTRSRGRSSEAEPKTELSWQMRRSDLVIILAGRCGDRWADELGSLLLLGSRAAGNASATWISDEIGSLLLDDLGQVWIATSAWISNDL